MTASPDAHVSIGLAAVARTVMQRLGEPPAPALARVAEALSA